MYTSTSDGGEKSQTLTDGKEDSRSRIGKTEDIIQTIEFQGWKQSLV